MSKLPVKVQDSVNIFLRSFAYSSLDVINEQTVSFDWRNLALYD